MDEYELAKRLLVKDAPRFRVTRTSNPLYAHGILRFVLEVLSLGKYQGPPSLLESAIEALEYLFGTRSVRLILMEVATNSLRSDEMVSYIFQQIKEMLSTGEIEQERAVKILTAAILRGSKPLVESLLKEAITLLEKSAAMKLIDSYVRRFREVPDFLHRTEFYWLALGVLHGLSCSFSTPPRESLVDYLLSFLISCPHPAIELAEIAKSIDDEFARHLALLRIGSKNIDKTEGLELLLKSLVFFDTRGLHGLASSILLESVSPEMLAKDEGLLNLVIYLLERAQLYEAVYDLLGKVVRVIAKDDIVAARRLVDFAPQYSGVSDYARFKLLLEPFFEEVFRTTGDISELLSLAESYDTSGKSELSLYAKVLALRLLLENQDEEALSLLEDVLSYRFAGDYLADLIDFIWALDPKKAEEVLKTMSSVETVARAIEKLSENEDAFKRALEVLRSSLELGKLGLVKQRAGVRLIDCGKRIGWRLLGESVEDLRRAGGLFNSINSIAYLLSRALRKVPTTA